MNKDHHETSVSTIATREGSGSRGPWAALAEGFMTGIRPFGPAIRLLLVTSLGVLAVMLLGIAMIYSAREMGPPAQRLLTLLGEGLLLLAALGMMIGCVRAWCQVFRASIKGPLGTIKSIKGEHDDHR